MTMLTLTAGTGFLIWLADQISDRGIGNGMALIVVAGIAVGFPTAVVLVLIGALVVYLVLMVRAILEMLRSDVNGVLLAFDFLALIAVPSTLVLGIMILIIWNYHKRDTLAEERQTW